MNLSVTETVADAAGFPVVHGGPHRIVETAKLDSAFIVFQPISGGHWCIVGDANSPRPCRQPRAAEQPSSQTQPNEGKPAQEVPSSR